MHSTASKMSSNSSEATLREQWAPLRDRLRARQLMTGAQASLSLRIPGGDAMWFGMAGDAGPACVPLAKAEAGAKNEGSEGESTNNESRDGESDASGHAALYAARPDAGAIAAGGGEFGRALADFGGAMPQVFDEQARHLGPMAAAAAHWQAAAAALANSGNVLLVQGRPVCLGMTANRLALNAELFEKCAKAYVLAAATGGRLQPLPWFVRFIANRRLRRDAANAAERFAQGMLPQESKGY